MSDPGVGHNSKAQLLAFVDRLVRLKEEQKALGEDITELKREAKGCDVEPKKLEALAKLKQKGEEDAKRDLEVHESYLETLGWLA
jgi:uncharacterized protein (UPF0335 family)